MDFCPWRWSVWWHILSWKWKIFDSMIMRNTFTAFFFLDRFLFPNFFVCLFIICLANLQISSISLNLSSFQERFVCEFGSVFFTIYCQKNGFLGDRRVEWTPAQLSWANREDLRRLREENHRISPRNLLTRPKKNLSHMFLNVFLMYHLSTLPFSHIFFHLKMCHHLILSTFFSKISSK